MPTPGYVFKDGGPIPDDELEGQKPNEQDTPGYTASSARPASTSTESPLNTPTSTLSTSNAPTDSHVLAEAEHDEKGATQHEHFEHEVRDLGWNDHPDDIPTPLVGGLPNEELWLLVRRFDKVSSKSFSNRWVMLTASSKANVPCQGHQRPHTGRFRP